MGESYGELYFNKAVADNNSPPFSPVSPSEAINRYIKNWLQHPTAYIFLKRLIII